MKSWHVLNLTVCTTVFEVCTVNTLKDTELLLIVVPSMKKYELLYARPACLPAKRCIVMAMLKCYALPGVLSRTEEMVISRENISCSDFSFVIRFQRRYVLWKVL
jgi:hypothetical protein